MDGRELKQYERWKQEVQDLRARNQHLESELGALRPESHRAWQRVGVLEQKVQRLSAENKRLKQQVKELTRAARSAGEVQVAAAKIKPSVSRRRRKKPGRKAGHAAALRPVLQKIDLHQDVPLPQDAAGRPSCPHCNTCLTELEDH